MTNNETKIILHRYLTFHELYEAYCDCRIHKRSTFQAQEFEYNLEQNLFGLYEELTNEKYKIGQSICFVVKEPKPREIWAGAFRDRIVHHLIYNMIKDRFEPRFIEDTYSCIPKRGTAKGFERAKRFAKNVTCNYSKTAYFLKADIQNYFNSIDKDILYQELAKFIPEKWLQNLIKQVLYHNPKENYRLKSPTWLYNYLPKYKSLFNTPSKKGLAIGNLTSQFFSNVYLNPLDQFVKHQLKCKYYCRYVDDIILFDENAGYLNWAYSEINKFLLNNLKLKLNHKKKIINKIEKGFDFIGSVNKYKRVLPRQKTINKMMNMIKKWEENPDRFKHEELIKFRATINSYLGLFKSKNTYTLRKKVCERVRCLFVYPNKDYTKIILTTEKPPKRRKNVTKFQKTTGWKGVRRVIVILIERTRIQVAVVSVGTGVHTPRPHVVRLAVAIVSPYTSGHVVVATRRPVTWVVVTSLARFICSKLISSLTCRICFRSIWAWLFKLPCTRILSLLYMCPWTHILPKTFFR